MTTFNGTPISEVVSRMFSALDRIYIPFLDEIPFNPADDLRLQPYYILRRIVTSCRLACPKIPALANLIVPFPLAVQLCVPLGAFGPLSVILLASTAFHCAFPIALTILIRRPRNVHNMHQRIRMPQVVQEPVPEALALVRARDQSCHIKQLDGDRALPVEARPVIRTAARLEGEACTSTWRAKVANRTVWGQGGEAVAPGRGQSMSNDSRRRGGVGEGRRRTGSCLRKTLAGGTLE